MIRHHTFQNKKFLLYDNVSSDIDDISSVISEDAGTYMCTATNQAGSATTTATLQVPGERRSAYIK